MSSHFKFETMCSIGHNVFIFIDLRYIGDYLEVECTFEAEENVDECNYPFDNSSIKTGGGFFKKTYSSKYCSLTTMINLYFDISLDLEIFITDHINYIINSDYSDNIANVYFHLDIFKDDCSGADDNILHFLTLYYREFVCYSQLFKCMNYTQSRPIKYLTCYNEFDYVNLKRYISLKARKEAGKIFHYLFIVFIFIQF